jgi:hypothetical protein
MPSDHGATFAKVAGRAGVEALLPGGAPRSTPSYTPMRISPVGFLTDDEKK